MQASQAVIENQAPDFSKLPPQVDRTAFQKAYENLVRIRENAPEGVKKELDNALKVFREKFTDFAATASLAHQELDPRALSRRAREIQEEERKAKKPPRAYSDIVTELSGPQAREKANAKFVSQKREMDYFPSISESLGKISELGKKLGKTEAEMFTALGGKLAGAEKLEGFARVAEVQKITADFTLTCEKKLSPEKLSPEEQAKVDAEFAELMTPTKPTLGQLPKQSGSHKERLEGAAKLAPQERRKLYEELAAVVTKNVEDFTSAVNEAKASPVGATREMGAFLTQTRLENPGNDVAARAEKLKSAATKMKNRKVDEGLKEYAEALSGHPFLDMPAIYSTLRSELDKEKKK